MPSGPASPLPGIMSGINPILTALEQGQDRPGEELWPLVYEELRKLAAHKMAQEAPGQTLQPTALVHEAWLRLGADAQPAWKNPAHFFAAAAEAMHRILVERAGLDSRHRPGGQPNQSHQSHPHTMIHWMGEWNVRPHPGPPS